MRLRAELPPGGGDVLRGARVQGRHQLSVSWLVKSDHMIWILASDWLLLDATLSGGSGPLITWLVRERREARVDRVVSVLRLSPTVRILASDWSRVITWSGNWPLIGCLQLSHCELSHEPPAILVKINHKDLVFRSFKGDYSFNCSEEREWDWGWQ